SEKRSKILQALNRVNGVQPNEVELGQFLGTIDLLGLNKCTSTDSSMDLAGPSVAQSYADFLHEVQVAVLLGMSPNQTNLGRPELADAFRALLRQRQVAPSFMRF